MSEYRELLDKTEPTEAQQALWKEVRRGDEEHWPCPHCPRERARQPTFRRLVRVARDGEEKAYRSKLESHMGTAGDLAGEQSGCLFGFLGALPSVGWQDARVYHCPEHGEFFLCLEDDGEPDPRRIVMMRNGRLEQAAFRFHFCMALIEVAAPEGEAPAFEICGRVVEWDEPPKDWLAKHAYSHTCPRHGRWRHGEGGALVDTERPIERLQG